jgi:hypothetical protein
VKNISVLYFNRFCRWYKPVHFLKSVSIKSTYWRKKKKTYWNNVSGGVQFTGKVIKRKNKK